MPPPGFVLLAYGRNTPYAYEAHTPLSLFCLGAFLEAHGVPVEYYDERIHPGSRFDELLAGKPLAVGLSVIGGYQIVSSQRLSRRARRLSPESRVVWGGFFPSCLPGEALAEGSVDFAVLGEGEETLLALCGALAGGGKDFSGIPGLAWRDAGSLVHNARRPAPDLETLPFPYHDKALPLLRRYLEEPTARETVGYETARGCPFFCAFCYSPSFHGPVRVKSPAKVRAELSSLRALGVSSLDIYDDVLMGGLLPEIGSLAGHLRSLGMAWMANLRIDMVSEGLLRIMEESDCRWLYFGLESDDDAVLQSLGKGFSAAQLREGLSHLRKSRIGMVFSIIAGLPLEGRPTGVDRALELAEELHRGHPEAEVQIQSFVPLPGSRLYSRALAQGFVPPKDLAQWVRHDHFSVSLPWLKDPALPRKAYLSSFFAYRYRRHLSRLPVSLAAYPLHLLSLWRIRRRAFRFYFEEPLYVWALTLTRAWTALRFLLRDGPGRREG